MKSIIQNITGEKKVNFTEEESTWFNGHMNVPVRSYLFVYPSILGKIEVTGEYRRNTWQKASWYKNLHFTDIYLWTIRLNARIDLPEIEISSNSWFHAKILNQPRIKVKCSNHHLKKSLENSTTLAELLLSGHENVSATIRSKSNILWTSFNSLLDHEGLLRVALKSFEEIENEINTSANN